MCTGQHGKIVGYHALHEGGDEQRRKGEDSFLHEEHVRRKFFLPVPELFFGMEQHLKHGARHGKGRGGPERGGVGNFVGHEEPDHGPEDHAERNGAAEDANARAESALGNEIHGDGGLHGAHGGEEHAVRQADEHEEQHARGRKAERKAGHACQRGEYENELSVEPVGNEPGKRSEQQRHKRKYGHGYAHDGFLTVQLVHEIERQHGHDGIARHAGAEVRHTYQQEISGEKSLPGDFFHGVVGLLHKDPPTFDGSLWPSRKQNF